MILNIQYSYYVTIYYTSVLIILFINSSDLFQYEKCLEACRSAATKLFDFFRLSVERKLSKVEQLTLMSFSVIFSGTRCCRVVLKLICVSLTLAD